jgi:hypothetical protein
MSPFRFSATPPRVGDPIGKLSEGDRGRPIGFERIAAAGSPAQ